MTNFPSTNKEFYKKGTIHIFCITSLFKDEEDSENKIMKTAIILALVALFVVDVSGGWGSFTRFLKKAGSVAFKAAKSPTGQTVIRTGLNLLGDVRAIREMDETEINQLFDAIQMIREMDDDEFLVLAKAASMEDFEY
uniref:uncharacterized protein LOC120339236 isoform X2 n=1 Tax=Styela clava TaxID=7725 RepID=UPI00193A404B|nr:uncharacterized protein LOC120339236 isoform X2 [Styela clava]